jgi:hypothetical protein
MQGPAKIATYLAVTMTLLGFLMIGLAWNFAAEVDFIQGQFPYFLSGGLGGLGLIIGGMAVMSIQTMRTITAQRAREMGRLQDEADALIRNVVKPGPGEMIDDETVIDVGNRTVVRTINRRPVDDARQAAPAGGAQPAGDFAPQSRAGGGASPAEEISPQPGLKVLDRDGVAVADEVWAPASDTGGEEDLRAALAEVSGVGPAKQEELASHFGTLEALRAASVDELLEVPGISRTLATRIRRAVR